jgi:SagB-type dehydrogenase family enzyme
MSTKSLTFGSSDPPHQGRVPTTSIEETIVGRTPALDDPTENYHEASRVYPGVVDATVRGVQLLESSNDMRVSASRSTKRYPAAPVVHLPGPNLGSARLADTLIRRRSARSFGSGRLTVQQLGTLLGAAYGVSGDVERSTQSFRTAPSGGALYPLELYVAARSVDGLDEALYHYDPLRHVVERLRPLDAARELEPLTPYPELVRHGAALVVMTAMFWRSRFKYGARAYRFTLIEAGHVGQNLLLAATGLELAAVPLGGFYDRRVDSFVGVDGLYEATIYVFAIAARA